MHYDDPNAFIEHSNNIQDAWKTIKKYNPGKKRINKLKKLNSIVTGLLTRGRKFNISIVLITQSYFTAPKKLD